MSILFLFWEVDESAKMYYHERKPLSIKTLAEMQKGRKPWNDTHLQ